MKYALNLAEDGRVLSITLAEFGTAESEKVDEFPDGNVAEYRYVGGEFVHDPLPKLELPRSDSERLSDLEEALAMLLNGVTE